MSDSHLPSTEVQSRHIVERVMSEHGTQAVARLGVSERYLRQIVADLGLTEEELSSMATLRVNHEAHFPWMVKLMKEEELTVPEVGVLYEARNTIVGARNGSKRSPPVTLRGLLRLGREASEVGLDDDSALASVVDRIADHKPEWMYLSTAVELVCDKLESMDIGTLDAALQVVSGRSDDPDIGEMAPDEDDTAGVQHSRPRQLPSGAPGSSRSTFTNPNRPAEGWTARKPRTRLKAVRRKK